jgi:hypothetical protein
MEYHAIEGGSLCGAVRYAARGTPYHVTHCHCADCRRSAGAAFVTWCSFRREDFVVNRGEIRTVEFAGRWRGFCPFCGSTLTFLSSPDSGEIDVTVGSFDHPERVSPRDHIWVDDRLAWISLADGLPQHARSRPSSPS